MESNLNSIYLIVGGFLIVTLVLGVYAGRGIKNIKEYVLGKGNFTAITLTLTFLATDIGGHDLLMYPHEVYKFGIIASSFWIGITIQNLLLGLFIAPKSQVFNGCMTIGDFVGRHYGKHAKLLTGALTLLRMICLVSIQLVMIGKILQFFFDIDIFWGVVLSGIILGLYTAFGGIKSVTYTDVFQFILLAIVVPIIATLLTKHFSSYKELFEVIPTDKFRVFSNKDFFKHLSYGLLLSLSFSGLVSPSRMQRIFMASSPKDAKDMFLAVTVVELVFGISVTIIGFSCLALYPNIQSDNMVMEVINRVVSNDLTKGLIITGILSVVISSADSYIHSTGLILFNDLLSPLVEIKDEKKLVLLKYTTFIIALITSFASLTFINSSIFKDLDLLKNLISLPILVFPIIFAIYGLKADIKIFYSSIVAGLLVVCMCYFYFFPGQRTFSVSLGMIANALVFMIRYFNSKGGLKKKV